jgi:hypothetical protein
VLVVDWIFVDIDGNVTVGTRHMAGVCDRLEENDMNHGDVDAGYAATHA